MQLVNIMESNFVYIGTKFTKCLLILLGSLMHMVRELALIKDMEQLLVFFKTKIREQTFDNCWKWETKKRFYLCN